MNAAVRSLNSGLLSRKLEVRGRQPRYAGDRDAVGEIGAADDGVGSDRGNKQVPQSRYPTPRRREYPHEIEVVDGVERGAVLQYERILAAETEQRIVETQISDPLAPCSAK